MADKYWEIETHNGVFDTVKGIGELDVFSFQLKRLKDIYTGMETIKILAFYKGDKYGTIVNKFAKLDTDIANLSNVGINLTRLQSVELTKIIKDNYYEMSVEVGEGVEINVSEELLNGILKYFKDYVEDKKIVNTNGFYNIPVAEFKTAFSESIFRHYNATDIKEALRIGMYIRCNAKRNDYSIKEDGVNHRYISFNADKLDKVN